MNKPLFPSAESSPFTAPVAVEAAASMAESAGMASMGVRITEADDADAHAANLSQWDQRYDQFSPGSFHGKVTELWLPQSQIFVETANRSLRQSCAAWPNSIWFGIPTPGSGLMSWGSRELPANAICVREGGAEFELLTAPDFNLFGVVVDREAFAEYLDQNGQPGFAQRPAPSDILCLPPALKAAVCQQLQAILSDARQHLAQADVDQGAALQTRIFATLAQLLGAGSGEAPASRRDHRQAYRHGMLDRLRAKILSEPDATLPVDELCEMFHLSRRALQNYFEEATGLAPLNYMRTLRLNAVRRSLLEGRGSVSEIASHWGFNHLGKFAHQYAAMFGELPSHTLARRH